jgi:4-oxalocrotonate tautomerase
MPIVHIELIEGRPASAKRALIQQVTAAVVNTLDVKPAQVRVLITEIKPEHWAIGGIPTSERPAAAAHESA